MNFKSIIKEIEQNDPAVYEQLSTRRNAIKSIGSKVALATLPLAIGSLFNKAYGKTTSASTLVAALNLALEMEYFQYNFYHTANAVSPGFLIPAADALGFERIEAHQKEHITLLNSVITGLGGTPFTPKYYSFTNPNPYVPAAYDFTAGGTYATVFNTYTTFLTLAQVFEDTAVHTYQGQMSNLLGNASVITQAFQLQCTEARHAAHVRLVRRNLNTSDNPAPWITNNVPPPPVTAAQPVSQFQSFYIGEDNTIQLFNTDITTLADSYGAGGVVPKISATAAFDEGMTSAQITSLIAPFLLP